VNLLSLLSHNLASLSNRNLGQKPCRIWRGFLEVTPSNHLCVCAPAHPHTQINLNRRTTVQFWMLAPREPHTLQDSLFQFRAGLGEESLSNPSHSAKRAPASTSVIVPLGKNGDFSSVTRKPSGPRTPLSSVVLKQIRIGREA
jgi:hypothetical protein